MTPEAVSASRSQTPSLQNNIGSLESAGPRASLKQPPPPRGKRMMQHRKIDGEKLYWQSFYPLPQTGATDAAGAERPGGEASIKDVDLERLEESLRWLQRQEAVMRLPRVARLPLVAGLTPPDTPRYRRADAAIPRPKSLEPEWMPPPPAAPERRYLRASLGFLGASIAAGAVGYYVARADWWPLANPSPAVHLAATSASKTVASERGPPWRARMTPTRCARVRSRS